MAFEGLTDKLQGVFKKLGSKGRLTEQDVKAAMREVRMALLEADVNYKVVKDFVARVTERAEMCIRDRMNACCRLRASTGLARTNWGEMCLAAW